MNGTWEIPTRDGEWQPTNPLNVNELTTAMNKDRNGMYVPTVELAGRPAVPSTTHARADSS